MQQILQGPTSDNVFWISILITHAPRAALGAVVTVSPNGRGASFVLILFCRRSTNLGSHQERQMDLVEVLSFLFMLSTMELGRVRRFRVIPVGESIDGVVRNIRQII